MKPPKQQIEELQEMIAQSKEPDGILVKNWKRSINILKSKL